ncbi:WYL domain-containing protein [Niallia sp.]|uniref:WYL domain-containing protein n=1 Tax=Niallia sp. TaxID=2837523 RepID=UPI00289A1F1C|nr:WYL domain-containing protein [Niallia sp.]
MKKQLEKAWKEKRPIEIIYVKKDSSISQRTILVYGVTDTYIKAQCLKKKQPRIFKVDSILAASFQSKTYKLYA